MHASSACLCTVLALCTLPVHAQVYGGRTALGTIVLSDVAGPDAPDLVVAAAAEPEGAMPSPSEPNPQPMARRAATIRSIVHEVARETALPVLLLDAVIAVESGYDAHAVSRKGARGLMQLMPATARRFGVADALDPLDNVRGGARYLKSLLELFQGDLQLALAGYNAGEQAVIRAGYRIPPYAETQRYVPRVLARLQRLSRS